MPLRNVFTRGVVALSVAALLSVGFVSTAQAGRAGQGTSRDTHTIWAGSGVGLIAWTVGQYSTAYKECGASTTYVEIGQAWNSQSLHNGAKLAMNVSAKRTNTSTFVQIGNLRVISTPFAWPGYLNPQNVNRHETLSTPGGVYVDKTRMTSWIENGGAWGISEDTITLNQSKNC